MKFNRDDVKHHRFDDGSIAYAVSITAGDGKVYRHAVRGAPGQMGNAIEMLEEWAESICPKEAA